MASGPLFDWTAILSLKQMILDTLPKALVRATSVLMKGSENASALDNPDTFDVVTVWDGASNRHIALLVKEYGDHPIVGSLPRSTRERALLDLLEWTERELAENYYRVGEGECR